MVDKNDKPKVIKIDRDKCIQCGGCCAVCPFRALVLKAGTTVEWDPEKCKRCGLCIKACPANAISFEEKKEGEDE